MILHKKEGRGKLLNPTNRPPGLKTVSQHSAPNLQYTAVGWQEFTRIKTNTRAREIHVHAALLGLIPNSVGSHQRAHVDPAEYQNIFGRDFSAEELTGPDQKELRRHTFKT